MRRASNPSTMPHMCWWLLPHLLLPETHLRLAIATMQGQGSGFVWDSDGHIVTNFHVIRGASEVQVALIDQSIYKAKIIGGAPAFCGVALMCS